ncbi:MAG: hypothetical protein QGH60_20275 [Phycisphaerae bacterium]|nr:hypothetical protein [Phycisphaerae bacterium]
MPSKHHRPCAQRERGEADDCVAKHPPPAADLGASISRPGRTLL